MLHVSYCFFPVIVHSDLHLVCWLLTDTLRFLTAAALTAHLLLPVLIA